MRVNPSSSARPRQLGLSLIELMIAMLLGLLLMGSVVGVVINSKTSFIAVRESAVLQENGRYAMELLTQEIRMAGYQECARGKAKQANSVNGSVGTWYLSWLGSSQTPPVILPGLQGFEGVAVPASSTAWPADYRAGVVANTDSIVVRRGDTTSYTVTVAAASQFTVNKATDFKVGELVMVVDTDCQQVGIFQTTNANSTTVIHATSGATPGNSSTNLNGNYNSGFGTPLPTSYRVGATVMRFNPTAFYIGQPSGANQPPALYRRKWTPPSSLQTDELVRGIENMQITYGLDTRDGSGAAVTASVPGDGIADKYVKASDTALTTWNNGINWSSVVSVKITLQLRSINPIYTVNTAFKNCDLSDGVADKYAHKCMTSTIAIRNQGV